MLLGSARHQTPGQPGRPVGISGEAAYAVGRDEALRARQAQTDSGPDSLRAQALAKQNMVLAWKRVKANGGRAGIDGRSVQDTWEYLKTHWVDIRQRLLSGNYRPEAVLRMSIPKPGGSQRELGIPTVVDRLIQQALLQVLQPRIDPTFSVHRYGFRPGRSAHGAVRQAQR